MVSPISPVSVEDIHSRFVRNGFVYPLQVFDDNFFIEQGYIERYKEFRKKCEVKRPTPAIGENRCKALKLSRRSIIIFYQYN